MEPVGTDLWNVDFNVEGHPNSVATMPLAIPIYTPQSREDVDEGGQVLFNNYLRQEMDAARVTESFDNFMHTNGAAGDTMDNFPMAFLNSHNGVAVNPTATSGTIPTGYRTSYWAKEGRYIRDIADEFARSREGERIRERAENVPIRDINRDGFIQLLMGLFSDGLTTERVVALFYFCSRIIIRAVLEKCLVPELLSWSLGYVRDRICLWVFEHGGWENVLTQWFPIVWKVGVVALIGVGIACGLLYMKKNW